MDENTMRYGYYGNKLQSLAPEAKEYIPEKADICHTTCMSGELSL